MKKGILLSLLMLLLFCGTANASAGPKLSIEVVQTSGGGHAVILKWTQSVGVTQPAPPAPQITCPDGTSNPVTITANTVYRSTTSGAEVLLTTITPPAITYTDAGTVTGFPLVPGTTYFYKVSASNCDGAGALSAEVSAQIPNPVTPSAPTGLGVTSVASNLTANPKIYAMTLGWTAPTKYTNGQPITGPLYFNIWRDIAGTEKYSRVNTSPVIGTAYFDDSGLKGGTQYNYQVTAWQLTGNLESAFSNKAGATEAK